MRILFLGGTGIISTACVELAVARGHDVTVLNRGHRPVPAGAKQLVADLHDPTALAAALASAVPHTAAGASTTTAVGASTSAGGNATAPVPVTATATTRTFDAVVDFVAFTPAELAPRLALFRGRCGQYVFIASASAYQKPGTHAWITESTPLVNPFWQYSRDKAACEDLLLGAHRDADFPVTIVRPSLTYGDTQVALVLNSWAKSFTMIDRLRRGAPVIVPGDGTSLWTITHNTDFAKGLVGLLGHPAALGHAFHITSDEALTWDQLYRITAAAAGAPPPTIVHIASDFLAACVPDLTGTLLGDKSHTALFDNTKLRRLVPDYVATTPYHTGIARTLAWFDADPARRVIDDSTNTILDRLLAAYARGLDTARATLGR